MPWLPMYIDSTDLKKLSSWLSNEPDIAMIQSNGEKQWIAKNEFSIRSSGRYCLFHRKSGPLPLLVKSWHGKEAMILDPFAGWKEKRTGANPRQPYFGSGHPAIYWLNVRIGDENEIGLSSFEWIVNHYAILGQNAPEDAIKWWGRLRRWVKKNSTHIPRGGASSEKRNEIYAFDASLKKIRNGIKCAMNS